ncbi:helix-turn-helix domain-containing protein [Flavobacterium taihuense]|uniref:Helix-turn-helix domain-containing protein n=1 Tax=Flavobacterium taihuense TaxID=2857508 RepID=A0ABS6XU07_9FLAO|nr:helix-turn-helix domain-containing protein [Flavobacterium taihuense]MBW4359344.1 helix-turn-helix domain-containing protein [Flavobacterium taihuense]
MEKPNNQERIVTVHQMLFEMARGNFNSHIPLSPYDDELETLAILINMVAEEIKESIFHVGYINTHNTQQLNTQTNFVLDADFFINSFSPEIVSFLGYSESDLIDQPMANILTAASVEQLQEVLHGGVSLPAIVRLDFTTKEHLPISVSCSVGKLINCTEIIVSLAIPAPQESYNPMAYENECNKQVKNRKEDAFLIQKLYDYILAHLEEPLPSLKLLSRQFGTNEHKLKDGFRHFFKSSIYQFYNDERLKRAYFMIQHTGIPLKNILVMNGFNNYPNFSKSFKRRFGLSPYELKSNEADFTTLPED